MMNQLAYMWITITQTMLRLLPFPCKTGLVEIGNPSRDSPVLLTCNFRLTVERVKRAVAGIDAYLLVANSRGVNVWCAATGGLLTNHDVISVLKTSGVAGRVDHRQVIFPQLAATGIEGKTVRKETGWTVVWGPVEAASIRAFLEAGRKTTQAMRTVTFPWQRRVEMAVAWAFPFSLLAMLVYFFRPTDVFPLVGLIWGMSFLIFLAFPLYAKWIRTDRTHVGFVLFDFGERAIPLVLWLLFMLGMVGYAFLSNTFSPMMIFRWGLISLVVLLLLSLDLTGSTPFYKSGLHKERLLRIDLDPKLCKGAGSCEQVCPTNVFEMDHARHLVRLPRADQCVQCGACIVQCPFDALCFRSPEGSVVTPATIRKFKLNLLGNRLRPKEVADAKSR